MAGDTPEPRTTPRAIFNFKNGTDNGRCTSGRRFAADKGALRSFVVKYSRVYDSYRDIATHAAKLPSVEM